MGYDCKEICIRQKNTTKSNRYSYSPGMKRCKPCSIWFFGKFLRCPCCNVLLRSNPRRGRKKKLQIENVKRY